MFGKLSLIVLNLMTLTVFTQTWHTVTTNAVVEFDMPDVPTLKDTLNTSFYYYPVDTLLSLQVQVFNDTEVSDTTGLFDAALQEMQGDTLRAMVGLMLSLSGHDLLSLDTVSYSGIPGLEVGISAENPDNSDYDIVIFTKLFYYNRNFISFVATSYASDITRLTSTKSQFFTSTILK